MVRLEAVQATKSRFGSFFKFPIISNYISLIESEHINGLCCFDINEMNVVKNLIFEVEGLPVIYISGKYRYLPNSTQRCTTNTF
jgi:hypothetical protein